MSSVSKLNPDGVFAEVLDGMVVLETTAWECHTIKAYKYGKQPNKGLGDEFIVVQKNGVTSAKTNAPSGFRGTLAVIVSCKLQPDNTAKEYIIGEILSQIENAAKNRTHGKYFYWLISSNLLQDTVPNPASGYSTTALNVGWKTTETYQ